MSSLFGIKPEHVPVKISMWYDVSCFTTFHVVNFVSDGE
jgi:hypothetical protein